MVAAVIEVGAISALLYGLGSSAFSLNKKQLFLEKKNLNEEQVTLPYYQCFFGCGLAIWLFVLLWPNRHYFDVHNEDEDIHETDIRKIRKLAKQITVITCVNMYGSFLFPFEKLPLLVRFQVLFQVSSIVALLLVWAFLSVQKYVNVRSRAKLPKPNDDDTREGRVASKEDGDIDDGEATRIPYMYHNRFWKMVLVFMKIEQDVTYPKKKRRQGIQIFDDGEAGENGGELGGGDRGGEDRGAGPGTASAPGPPTLATPAPSTSAFPPPPTPPPQPPQGPGGHGEGRGRGVEGGNMDLASHAISSLTQMTGIVISYYIAFQPSPSQGMIMMMKFVLGIQLVSFLSNVISTLIKRSNPNSEAPQIFLDIGTAFLVMSYIFLIAMFIPWYYVLIIVLLFCGIYIYNVRRFNDFRALQIWNERLVQWWTH